MPQINQSELHSEEVQEVMGIIPQWIIRWGLTMIFSIFAMIIIGSYFFYYPEIIEAPLIITTYNTPAILEAKSSGKIEHLFVEDEQIVIKGQYVGIIKNATTYNDLKFLDSTLSNIQIPVNWDKAVIKIDFSNTLSLGELQGSYTNFEKNCKQFYNYKRQQYVPIKLKLLNEQINKKKEMHNVQLQQLELQRKDLCLSVNSYQRDSMYYHKKNSVITKAEYETSLLSFVQKQIAFKGFENSIKNSEASLLQMEESKIELQLQYQKELDNYTLTLNENLQLIKSSIAQWKQQFLITSPINGKITFTNLWNENQIIKAGNRLATVVPSDETQIMAKVIIPPASLGKIKKS